MMDRPSKPKKKGFSIFPWDWNDKPEKRPPPKPAAGKKERDAKSATVSSRTSRTKPSSAADLPPQPAPRSKRPGLSLSPSRTRPTEVVKPEKCRDASPVRTRRSESPVVVRRAQPPSPSTSSARSSVVKREPVVERVVMRETVSKRAADGGGGRRVEVVSQPVAVPVASVKSAVKPASDKDGVRPTSLSMTLTGASVPALYGSAWDTGRTGIASKESANLTFEGAVLVLIRLRRIESQLHRTRDRFVKELELFRGWSDERYVYVLEQIAKSNQQMDELEPLIASLEAFIKEQQSGPLFVPEHEVIRYPLLPTAAQPPPRPPPAGRDAVERELDELRRQVRELQVERDYYKSGGENEYEVLRPGRTAPAAGAGTVTREDTVSARSWKLASHPRDEPAASVTPAPLPEYKGNNGLRTRSASESREKLTASASSKPPHAQPVARPSAPDPPVRGHAHSHSSASSSAASASDEVSVDEPYMSRYADFNPSPEEMPTEFERSLSQLQEIMKELEEQPRRCPNLNCFASDRDSPEEAESLKVLYHYSAPSPPPKQKSAARRRRHHTISSAAGRDILEAVRKAADDREHYAVPAPSGSQMEEISYDLQLRLDSPEKIYIPERFTDFEEEPDDASVKRERRLKAENIRRMLATPAPGESDRQQKEREKVLLMTPILAREVTERSRRFARQAGRQKAL
ncbi:uncharacterized protein LOC129590959 isoform X2 [Paramacrobiotus metropolitanus]|uniref:uncharacterized protein LOC129590959 isoform X2 n=1 Tax=Paramacrobiotus metropolitanus TaxID=2943436 RepID=UPI002445C118|nr:uncharacterized protein LOC129590959 isoform X2 [Paramacrobiotus metropolitanus]